MDRNGHSATVTWANHRRALFFAVLLAACTAGSQSLTPTFDEPRDAAVSEADADADSVDAGPSGPDAPSLERPDAGPPARCALEVDDVDLGEVRRFATRRIQLAVRNGGTEPCRIDGVETSTAALIVRAFPNEIGPLEEAAVDLSLSTRNLGIWTRR